MKYEKAGMVESVNGSTGPSAGITYDVRINLPGSPNLLVQGVRSCIPHWWTDDQADTVPCRVGTPFGLLVFGTDYYYEIPEGPALNICP